MKLLLIGAKDSRAKNDIDVLAKGLRPTFGEIACTYWEDLVFVITKGHIEVSGIPADTSHVLAFNWYRSGNESIYRDVALAAGLYWKSKDISCWNSEITMQRSTTKLSCMMQLALQGISVPPTLFSLDAQALADAVEKKLQFPVVVKKVAASRGRNNHLIQSKQQIEALLTKDLSLNTYMAQAYLPNSHDLRIICFGGEPKLALKRSRINDATHLNNTSLGAAGTWLDIKDLPEALLHTCRTICTLMGREMAGIDFIPDQNSAFGYSCLEVNAIPQLTSGFDTEHKMEVLADTLKAMIGDKV